LTHKAQEIGYHPEMILAGRRINDTMDKYIADSTILEMTKAGINPVGAKIAVLGLTFKENCPDLRNTKVPNIIQKLKVYGCEVVVSDPCADKDEARDHLNIELVDLNEVNKNDVVILAVGHNDYKEITKKQWQALLNDKGIFFDVKSIYKNDYFTNTDIKHWRL